MLLDIPQENLKFLGKKIFGKAFFVKKGVPPGEIQKFWEKFFTPNCPPHFGGAPPLPLTGGVYTPVVPGICPVMPRKCPYLPLIVHIRYPIP